MKYLIANWKAHKTLHEVNQWLVVFMEKIRTDSHVQSIIEEKARVVICPPFPFIPIVKNVIPQGTSIFVGSQDVSMFDEGSNTGETTAKMLSGLVRFTIVGHSERRILFHESETTIEKKVNLAKQYEIEPVLCIRDEKDLIHNKASIIAYEPHEAVGTGHFKTLNEVLEAKKLLRLSPHMNFIYGGSVNQHMCRVYFENPEIQGLLVGNASLDPIQFFQILSQVV